jgi:hypothetical protein
MAFNKIFGFCRAAKLGVAKLGVANQVLTSRSRRENGL